MVSSSTTTAASTLTDSTLVNVAELTASAPVGCAAVLDVRRLRTEFDEVAAALARRGDGVDALHTARDLDERQRALAAEADTLRHQVKELSAQVGKLRKAGETAEAEKLQEESRSLGEEERGLRSQADEIGR